MNDVPDRDVQIAEFLAGTLTPAELPAFVAALRVDAALRDRLAAASFFSPLRRTPRDACAAARGESCARLDRRLSAATRAHLRGCAPCAVAARAMAPRRSRVLRAAVALAATAAAAVLVRRCRPGG